MAHTDYQIDRIFATPFDNHWVVNDVAASHSERIDASQYFLYNTFAIHAIRWNSEDNVLRLELSDYDPSTDVFIGRGTEIIEGVTNPRENNYLSSVINFFNRAYCDELYEQFAEEIAMELEQNKEQIDEMFFFDGNRVNMLMATDFVMLPDAQVTEEERQQWVNWRQSVRDWNSSGDNITDIESNPPTPPTLEGPVGKMAARELAYHEQFREFLRIYRSLSTLNFTRTNITEEEYLENGPLTSAERDDRYFSENQFLSQYTTRSV